MSGKTYYVAYGEGDAGMHTMYGIGATPEEALLDSVQYGYCMDADFPHLFVGELSEKAYGYIVSCGANDTDGDEFRWISTQDSCRSRLVMADENMEEEE